MGAPIVPKMWRQMMVNVILPVIFGYIWPAQNGRGGVGESEIWPVRPVWYNKYYIPPNGTVRSYVQKNGRIRAISMSYILTSHYALKRYSIIFRRMHRTNWKYTLKSLTRLLQWTCHHHQWWIHHQKTLTCLFLSFVWHFTRKYSKCAIFS